MNPYTQPRTDEERRRRQDWLQRQIEDIGKLQVAEIKGLNLQGPLEGAPYDGGVVTGYHINDDGPNPGEFDWFAVNRDFS